MFTESSRKNRRRVLQALLAGSAAVAASLPVCSFGADVVPAGTLVVLGDSLSAEYGLRRGTGWVEQLAERLRNRRPPWSTVNASISGETTAGGRSRIDALLRQHEPRIVIVELGANDALRGLNLNNTEANLDAIVAASARAHARVLLLGMQVPPNYGAAYGDAFAALFARVAARHEAALVPFFLQAIVGDPRYFQSDRIHPAEGAQPLLFDTVWPELEPLLRAQTTH